MTYLLILPSTDTRSPRGWGGGYTETQQQLEVNVIDDRDLDGSPERKLCVVGLARYKVIFDWQPKEKGSKNLLINTIML